MATNWVFLLAGQSNARGEGDAVELVDPSYGEDFPSVRYAYSIECHSVDAPEQACNGTAAWRDLGPRGTARLHGPELAIGRALHKTIANENNSVHLIVSATGGTDLYDDWDPNATSGRYHYHKMRSFWNAQKATLPAGDFKFGGVFWVQGERDAQDILGGPNYEANLIEFIAAIKEDIALGEDFPFVAATLSANALAWTYKPDVNAAFNAVASMGLGMLPFYTESIELQSDYTHYSTNGLMALGNGMATRSLEYWGYTLTTTTKLIREQQETLIRALSPAQHAGTKFKLYERSESFEDWADSTPQAAMRQFYIEDVGEYGEPLSADGDSEEWETLFRVQVAYPKDSRYGLKNKSSAMDTIRADMHQIDRAVGLMGAGNYVAGQQRCVSESKTAEELENVWLLTMEYNINFRRAI